MGKSAFSTQAFYKKDVSSSPCAATAPKILPHDDGFTQLEVDAGYNPLDRLWQPSGEYEEVCISQIHPGPTRILFTGRIVNYTPALLDANNTYTRPAHQLIVTDDTGAIGVKLVPIGIPVSFLVIGQLVTIWASWTGAAARSSEGSIPFVTMYTSINPADVGSKQFIRFLPDSAENRHLCRLPLEYGDDKQKLKPLPGLMTLGQYLKSGHDTQGARIIVCVKNIGCRKRITPHNRTKTVELLEVTVWDDTASCVLTLWEDKVNSAKLWKPNMTILLLTSPNYIGPRDGKLPPMKAGLSLSHNTLVDVDPNFADANWLRKWVRNRIKNETVYVPFPQDVWNIKEAVYGPIRPLFTLAEVDDFARTDPATDFTGKLSVTVLGVNLLGLYRKKMLCCTEW
ncbi:hypothetical protein CCHL11_05393 [Colletotrichum chlorophyti]|uniref:Uncharacterized protein n=1 Tax=Colletotrichum chlorophyti TaxID=708187 RepID=A0A1Q8RNE9_9PEZI|nr:hypothetical protein CCHL11_05393 [Colletotrichum chlorophyti]